MLPSTGSSEASIIALAQQLITERGLVAVEGQLVGAIAAIPKTDRAVGPDLNYSEIFIRDNVPVMIYLLIQGKFAIVRHFLETCLKLQSQQFQTRGIFPTSFVEQDGQLVADYGQRAIGRVISVDATLWWVILLQSYVARSGDRAFAQLPQVRDGLAQFLDLVLQPSFRDAPTLYVPDGAFMIDRPLDVWGAPLEIQTLLYGALKSAAALLSLNRPMNSPTEARSVVQLQKTLHWLKRLRKHLLKHYWVTSKTVQILRRRPTEQYGVEIENEYNIQTETIPHWLQDWLGEQGGYLIGNIRTGRPDFRFFTLGNCLGAIFDVISPQQQRSLFKLILDNRHHLIGQMPMRICHPPLEDADWRKKTGYDRKNLPWCYHNGGHWPCLMWFLTVAVLRHEQMNTHNAEDHQQITDMRALLAESYDLMLKQLPQQQWAEYFDGPTGIWMGQQARGYQTWTIVGFLLVHHLLRVNPADALILNLPPLAGSSILDYPDSLES
jgi:Alkaline and neutral invertase